MTMSVNDLFCVRTLLLCIKKKKKKPKRLLVCVEKTCQVKQMSSLHVHDAVVTFCTEY